MNEERRIDREREKWTYKYFIRTNTLEAIAEIDTSSSIQARPRKTEINSHLTLSAKESISTITKVVIEHVLEKMCSETQKHKESK